MIKKFRQRVILQGWRRYLNIDSGHMVMLLKARKYHAQALGSKALLSIYMYTLKQNKARDFRRKNVYKKFFKKIWMPQFEKSKALRLVVKMIAKKADEWERTRYQREFTYLMNAFEIWKVKLEERRDLIKQYNALTHYRGHLLIKHFNYWKSKLIIRRGLEIMHRLVLGRACAPSFE